MSTAEQSTTPSEKAGKIERIIVAFLQTHRIAPDAGVIRMWLSALQGLSAEQVLNGMAIYNREHTGFATPAALAKCCGALSAEDRAEIAWGYVNTARRCVNHKLVEFSDPIATAAIRQMGGMAYLIDGETTWMKKEFVAAYERVYRTGEGNCSPLSFRPDGADGVQNVVVSLPAPVAWKPIQNQPVGVLPDQVQKLLGGIGDIGN